MHFKKQIPNAVTNVSHLYMDCGNGKSKPHHCKINKYKTSLRRGKQSSNTGLNRFYFEKRISICDNWQVYGDTREDWKSMNSVETYDIIWNISEKF